MSQCKVLLAGEFRTSTATNHTGADEPLTALKSEPLDVNFMPSHQAWAEVPQSLEVAWALDVAPHSPPPEFTALHG